MNITQSTYKSKTPKTGILELESSSLGTLVVGTDFAFQIFDIKGESWTKTYSGHKGGITNIFAIPGQESCVLTTSWDKTCRLWDVRAKSSCVHVFQTKEEL